MPAHLDRSWRMAPDNFTPPSRTPWGGRVILERFKAGLALDPERAAYSVVGESWEVSVEPSFPSRVVNLLHRPTLEALVAAAPDAVLGRAVAERDGGCPLLVKLLDSAQPLSVQVHPADHHPGLAADQSGKPESWVIVAHEPGAALYLGFRDGVRRRDVEAALAADGDLEPLLQRVPVSVGDCFELEPGTAHAIGAGVTLVEPQIIRPGRRGVTYRFWDWNRRYDEAGRLDAAGRPRALHVAESLAVTDFGGPSGEAFVETLRRRPRLVAEAGAARRECLIDGPRLVVERWLGTGPLEVDGASLLAGVVVRGTVAVAGARSGTEAERFRMGEAFVLPHALLPSRVVLESAEVIASAPAAT